MELERESMIGDSVIELDAGETRSSLELSERKDWGGTVRGFCSLLAGLLAWVLVSWLAVRCWTALLTTLAS